MLSWNKTVIGDPQKPYREGACLSTDTKPTSEIANGSILVEMDTSKVTFFDEENTEWREF